jgi:uncharacterized coiled-coil protein SlyX
MADYEKKHKGEIDGLKSKLGEVDKALKECANIEHFLGIDKKHGSLSEQQMKDAEAARGRFGELDSKMKAAEATLDGIARKVTDQQGALARKISALEAVEDGFKKRLDDLTSKHSAITAPLDDRITRVESMVSGSLGTVARDVEAAQGNAREVNGKIEAQKGAMENLRSLIDQRFAKLEAGLEGAAGHEYLRDIEQRLNYMVDDQKRSRDMLESSLLEQIRLEHSAVHSQATQIKEQWDREVRARQAYQESYKDLLGQERQNRESNDYQLATRVQNFEKSIYGEIQRMWAEIGKEQPPVIIQAAPPQLLPPQVIKEVVMPPAIEYVAPPTVFNASVMSPRIAASSVTASPLNSYVSTTSAMPFGTTSVSIPAMGGTVYETML